MLPAEILPYVILVETVSAPVSSMVGPYSEQTMKDWNRFLFPNPTAPFASVDTSSNLFPL